MRRTFLFFLFLLLQTPWTLKAQDTTGAPADLAEFLARYEDSLRLLEAAYDELAVESLPLRDEWGRIMARRRIDDRRTGLENLRKTIRQLRTSPLDLVLTTRLLVQTETMVDDLFDLSQIAYDNDSEELGKRLSTLMRTADYHSGIVEAYALSLAARQQARLHELEEENRMLRRRGGGTTRD